MPPNAAVSQDISMSSPAASPHTLAAIRAAHLMPYSPPFSPGMAPAYITSAATTSMTEFSLDVGGGSSGPVSQRSTAINPRPSAESRGVKTPGENGVSAPAQLVLLSTLQQRAVGSEGEETRLVAVRRIIEYYFSHENLLGDKFLVEEMAKDPHGFVSLSLVTALKRICALNVDVTFVAEALKSSKRLVVDAQGLRVRRKKKFTANTGTNPLFLRKCLRVTGLSEGCTVSQVKSLFDIIIYREDSELPSLENHAVYVKFDDDSDHTWAWVGFTTDHYAKMFVTNPPQGVESCVTKLDYLKQLKQDSKARKAERRRSRTKSIGESGVAVPSSPVPNPTLTHTPHKKTGTTTVPSPGASRRLAHSPAIKQSNWRQPAAKIDSDPGSTGTSPGPTPRQRRLSRIESRQRDKAAANDPRFRKASDAGSRPKFLTKRKVSDAVPPGVRMAKGPDQGGIGFSWPLESPPNSISSQSNENGALSCSLVAPVI